MSEHSFVVRLALAEDAVELAAMVDDFVKGHPAEEHPRSRDSLEAAYFGPDPVAEVVVAERSGRVVGMAQWARYYDMFWDMYGGRADWLFVRASSRGLGISAALLARVCERIRDSGGSFLYGQGTDETSSLYRRSAIPGPPVVDFHLGDEAFESVADLAGLPPREVVRGLPERARNWQPAK